MTKILGTPTRLSLRVGRVLSDKDYGSFRVEAEIEVTLLDGEDADKSFQSVVAWLKANVGHDIKAQKAAYDQLQPAAEYGIGDSRATPPPREDPNVPVKAVVTPVATPQADSGQMVTEVWQHPKMTLEFKGDGEPYFMVKGGKWQMHGAPAWKESIPFPEYTGWADRDQNNIKIIYDLPDGLTEVVVQMNEKGQPKKVIEFR